MLITFIAALIGLGYFFYPPRFNWVRSSVKYLAGIFCFWAAILFAEPQVQPSIWRAAGLLVLLISAFLLLADFTTSFVIRISERLSLIFKRKIRLPAYLEAVWSAYENLAARKVGALIVIQRNNPLRASMRGPGISFDAEVIPEILIPLFFTTSPVHDGAVIINKGRIRAVKAILPLATVMDGTVNFGTRHRAAIGITEKTDAVALVVSEERGQISIASRGCLVRVRNGDEFRRVLSWILKGRSLFKLKDIDVIATTKVLDDLV